MKNQIIEAVSGYGRANEYLEHERMQQLAHMTPEQARDIFDALVATWKPANDPAGLKRLDTWRIETLIATRRAFMQLAHAKGYL